MNHHEIKEQEMRVSIIRSITQDLIYHGCEAIEPETFDILYDYDIDELLQAREDIHLQIREILRFNKKAIRT